MSLHSYVVNTKSKGKKNVLMLSTMPPLIGVTKDDGKRKPAIMKFYDFSKGGTDIVDQRISNYSVQCASRRWTMAAFAYVLDTARVNSQTMYAINTKCDPRSVDSFNFGWDLVLELTTPHIRSRNLSGLQKEVVKKINLYTENDEGTAVCANDNPIIFPSTSNKKRCVYCVDAIKGQGYSKNRMKINPIQKQCQKCGKATCRNHGTFLCEVCKSNACKL